MKYSCEICNYETNDKSNFNKHLKSVAHVQKNNSIANSTKIGSNAQKDKKQPIYQCKHCEKVFKHQSSLSRHVNNRCKEKKEIQHTTEINDLKNIIYELSKHITKPNINIINNNSTTTINRPVINIKYVKQPFLNAPALKKLDNYNALDNYDNDKHSPLINKLINYQEKNELDRFLGDFIILFYKKEDPSKQSLWSSDVARFTYIIKELLEDKKESIWNTDPMAIRTVGHIIRPLLNNIKSKIEEHLDYTLADLLDHRSKQIEKTTYTRDILEGIKTDIDSNTLEKDIIRYITPFFHIKNNTTKTIEQS